MFLTIEPYLHLNCLFMLNWIIWNRTVFDIETVIELFLHLTVCKQNLYLY